MLGASTCPYCCKELGFKADSQFDLTVDLPSSALSLHCFIKSMVATKAIECLDAVDMASLLLCSGKVRIHMVPSGADIA